MVICPDLEHLEHSSFNAEERTLINKSSKVDLHAYCTLYWNDVDVGSQRNGAVVEDNKTSFSEICKVFCAVRYTGLLVLKVDRAPTQSGSPFPAQECTRRSLETKNSSMQPGKFRNCRWTVNYISLTYKFYNESFDLNTVDRLYEMNLYYV